MIPLFIYETLVERPEDSLPELLGREPGVVGVSVLKVRRAKGIDGDSDPTRHALDALNPLGPTQHITVV